MRRMPGLVKQAGGFGRTDKTGRAAPPIRVAA